MARAVLSLSTLLAVLSLLAVANLALAHPSSNREGLAQHHAHRRNVPRPESLDSRKRLMGKRAVVRMKSSGELRRSDSLTFFGAVSLSYLLICRSLILTEGNSEVYKRNQVKAARVAQESKEPKIVKRQGVSATPTPTAPAVVVTTGLRTGTTTVFNTIFTTATVYKTLYSTYLSTSVNPGLFGIGATTVTATLSRPTATQAVVTVYPIATNAVQSVYTVPYTSTITAGSTAGAPPGYCLCNGQLVQLNLLGLCVCLL